MNKDKTVDVFPDDAVYVPKSYLKELEEKAKECDYYRGRVDGLEYVLDTLENTFKSKGILDDTNCSECR